MTKIKIVYLPKAYKAKLYWFKGLNINGIAEWTTIKNNGGN